MHGLTQKKNGITPHFTYQRVQVSPLGPVKSLEIIRSYCESKNINYKLNEVKTIKEAKKLPCVFNNFAVFYKGEFKTINLLDLSTLERIIKK